MIACGNRPLSIGIEKIMQPSERVPGACVISGGSVALCGIVMSPHGVQKAFKMVHVGLIHALPSWPAPPKNAHGHA